MKLTILSILIFASPWILAQDRTFTFSQVSARNQNADWVPQKNARLRTAQFSSDKINMRLDRDYALKIVSTTHLPDNGVVYVCDDQFKSRVTVMLIDNAKMFVYDNRNRYLVKFSSSSAHGVQYARNR